MAVKWRDSPNTNPCSVHVGSPRSNARAFGIAYVQLLPWSTTCQHRWSAKFDILVGVCKDATESPVQVFDGAIPRQDTAFHHVLYLGLMPYGA
jgi:hypothetical protein